MKNLPHHIIKKVVNQIEKYVPEGCKFIFMFEPAPSPGNKIYMNCFSNIESTGEQAEILSQFANEVSKIEEKDEWVREEEDGDGFDPPTKGGGIPYAG